MAVVETRRKRPIQLELDKAIGAHSMWRMRIQLCIDTGRSELIPSRVADDHHCEFGRWLHHPHQPPLLKQSPHFKQVSTIHAEFHRVAAQALTLATSGRKTEAQALLKHDGLYSTIAIQLTDAMMAWRNAVL